MKKQEPKTVVNDWNTAVAEVRCLMEAYCETPKDVFTWLNIHRGFYRDTYSWHASNVIAVELLERFNEESEDE